MPRIMTYNVHSCVGVDRRLDVERVAAVIAAARPDIVCLQELDVGRARTGGVDQAHAIAARLNMTVHFNAALKVAEERYGDAILTHLPMRLVKTGPLPTLPRVRGLESRGALLVGDFNATSRYAVYRAFTGALADAQRLLQRQGKLKRALRTFPSRTPMLRIDHCFVSAGVRMTAATVPGDLTARMASDHLPLVLDFEVEAA